MNAQSASTTQSQPLVPRVAEADFRFSRNYPGLLASLGFAALVLVSAPALAQTYLGTTAQTFAVLAGSTVTCPTVATVTGDLGVSPGSAVTGFPSPCTLAGTKHAADGVALTAQNELTTAYNSLASQACTLDLTGQDLGTVGPLLPGVYCFSTSAQLTGTLTLNAQSDPNAVFIFKMGSTLTTATGAIVNVINGDSGSACGVSWLVGSSATLNTGTQFRGNIVALTSITLNGASIVSGRALARNGAVTAGNASNVACVGGGFTGSGLPPVGAGPSPGSISIVKNTLGGNGTFPFTASGTGVTGFPIVTAGGTGEHTFTGLSAGTYTFRETPIPAGWSLTGLTCVDPTGDSTVTFATGTASVNLTAGEAVTCTYTNTLAPTGIPTLSEWALIMLAMLLLGTGWLQYRRRQ